MFMNPKQTYSIYRESHLIASDCPTLSSARRLTKKDALDERSADRFPSYTIMGTLGFKLTATHQRRKMRWDFVPSKS
jgi:hypothetical protein